MKICIPVKKDQGLESKVSAHFGSAPMFLLVDSDTQGCEPIVNANQHHQHGMCRPLAMLGGHDVDAVVVGGIGRGAFLGLRRAGIAVLLSDRKTVDETLRALQAGELAEVDDSVVCAHHGQGHGHGPHGHGHGHGPGGCDHHGSPTTRKGGGSHGDQK